MRLINVKTFKLCEIPKPDDDLPYAILSHTWGKDEVTFQEFLRETSREGFSKEDLKENARYEKIVRCCAEAELHGFDYVWIDTCCIDKTSSSELSEAINSMYQWYKQAPDCYAYLSDVESDTGILDMKSFRDSRWFTRGWTLQELIAPRHVVFFDRDWSDIGTKLSLQGAISEITGVPFELLAGREDAPLGSFCIAQRMSWAANRRTTRDEDIAYCLMGIFDVNMPILYGEGEKAFIRLQDEIMKGSDDQSLFSWISDPSFRDNKSTSLEDFRMSLIHPRELRLWRPAAFLSSVLATSPASFMYGRFIKRIEPTGSEASHFSLTNKGLLISLPLMRTDFTTYLWEKVTVRGGDSTVFLAVLDCKITYAETPLAVLLIRHSSGGYIRIAPGHLSLASDGLRCGGNGLLSLPDPCELYIKTSIPHFSTDRLYSRATKDPCVKLLVTNCTVMECGTAHYGSYPRNTILFAFRIKSQGTGRGDAMVVLAQKDDHVRLSCSVYQLRGSPPFHRALLDWWTKNKPRPLSNTSGSIETDRATVLLTNGDNLTVSVNIDVNPPFCVVVKWVDQQAPQPRVEEQFPVSGQREQGPRAYREMQKRHEVKLADWTIFSQEISLLPPDKRYLGLELK